MKGVFIMPELGAMRQATRAPSNKCPTDKLGLSSGEKVRQKPVLTISKLVSLELTLVEYKIQPNARTLARIGGAE